METVALCSGVAAVALRTDNVTFKQRSAPFSSKTAWSQMCCFCCFNKWYMCIVIECIVLYIKCHIRHNRNGVYAMVMTRDRTKRKIKMEKERKYMQTVLYSTVYESIRWILFTANHVKIITIFYGFHAYPIKLGEALLSSLPSLAATATVIAACCCSCSCYYVCLGDVMVLWTFFLHLLVHLFCSCLLYIYVWCKKKTTR